MSMKLWKKEFYPVPANKVAKKDALAHSLRKWEGLTKAALRKHGIEVYGCSLYGKDGRWGLSISNESCALCHKFYDREQESCTSCPLVNCEKQFQSWCNRSNPNPMLALLRKAVRTQAKKGKA